MRFSLAAAVATILLPSLPLCAAEVVSPAEIVVIFGSELGPADLATLEVANGFVTTESDAKEVGDTSQIVLYVAVDGRNARLAHHLRRSGAPVSESRAILSEKS